MRISISINAKNSILIGSSDTAFIIGCLPDDQRHATFFSRLIDHPAAEVRGAVAAMSCMDADTLEQLAADNSIEVVQQVARNKRALRNFKKSLILKMIERDVSVAAEIAENLEEVQEDYRAEITDVLSQHPDPKVRRITTRYLIATDVLWDDDDNELDEGDD